MLFVIKDKSPIDLECIDGGRIMLVAFEDYPFNADLLFERYHDLYRHFCTSIKIFIIVVFQD